MRHLIGPLDFTLEETNDILDFADRIAGNRSTYAHIADGKKLATLFYEPPCIPQFLSSMQEMVVITIPPRH